MEGFAHKIGSFVTLATDVENDEAANVAWLKAIAEHDPPREARKMLFFAFRTGFFDGVRWQLKQQMQRT